MFPFGDVIMIYIYTIRGVKGMNTFIYLQEIAVQFHVIDIHFFTVIVPQLPLSLSPLSISVIFIYDLVIDSCGASCKIVLRWILFWISGFHLGSGSKLWEFIFFINGLVPSCSKPFTKFMLTQIYIAIWRHYATMGLGSSFWISKRSIRYSSRHQAPEKSEKNWRVL